MARKKKRAIASGCLFGAILVIVLAIAAIAARKPIEDTIAKVFKGGHAQPETVVTPLPQSSQTLTIGAKPETPTPTETTAQSSTPENTTVTVTQPTTKPQQDAEPQAARTPAEKPLRKARLFFAQVDPNGKLVMKSVIRSVPSSDSPLRDTLQSLLSGPTSQEVNMGLLTMVPGGTELKDVAVKGDTAYIDFSESFRFNTLGKDGLDAEVQQVVYAATEFPTVKKVQILIDGKKVQYLGPEGIRVDAPLGRGSFEN